MVAALPGDIATTDPVLVNDSNSAYVLHNVVEGLMGFRPGTISNPIPVLAAKPPVVSKDGMSYTFALRHNVKFHDGTPFNAAAVQYNFRRWLNMPPALQPYAVYVGNVFGFGQKGLIRRIRILDSYTVRFRLRRPNSSFLTYLTLPYFAISSPTALKAGGADNSVTTPTQIPYARGGPTAATGTGPFQFKEWVPGDHVSIERNPKYWDSKHSACLSSVVFKPIPDEAAVLNNLQSGAIDFAQVIVPADVPAVSGNSQTKVLRRGASCNMLNIAITQSQTPMDDVRIRQAVAYAVNKKAYADAFFGGLAVPADNFMPLSIENAKALHLPKYNPAKARSLLRGFTKDQLTVTVAYPSNVSRPYMPDPKGIFQAIQADLEAVGFKVVPRTDIWSPTYLNNSNAGLYPMAILGITCQWAGPDNFLKTNYFGYVDGKPIAKYAYKNDTLQATMNNALSATNAAAAKKLWYRAEEILAKDMPIIPLVNSRPPAAARSYVKGFVGAGTLLESLNSVWLDK